LNEGDDAYRDREGCIDLSGASLRGASLQGAAVCPSDEAVRQCRPVTRAELESIAHADLSGASGI
jgi:uncharacterized protein YjbI with pentapeptide repeats